MQTRRFGRTGHASTVAIFGAVTLGKLTQAHADQVMEQVIAAGINHIDVAPSYSDAELRLGPWMPRERHRFFLGCKTTERTQGGATAELHRSLERLQIDALDLYQLHAVKTWEILDEVTAPGGALAAAIQAREQGLTKHIGITGHGVDAPAIFLEALRRFDFDSVLFPLNFVQYANPTYRQNAEALIAECRQRDIGTMVIKTVCKRPWGEREPQFHTWYEPFTDSDMVQQCVNFALSQDVTGLCTVGDYRVLPQVLRACENFKPMSTADQAQLIATADQYAPLFA